MVRDLQREAGHYVRLDHVLVCFFLGEMPCVGFTANTTGWD